MNKALLKRLKQVADGLPDVLELKPAAMTGEEWVKAGKKRDGQGKNLLKRKIYYGKTWQKTEHLTKIKAAYKAGGDDAVTAYAASAERMHNAQKKMKAPEVNTI